MIHFLHLARTKTYEFARRVFGGEDERPRTRNYLRPVYH